MILSFPWNRRRAVWTVQQSLALIWLIDFLDAVLHMAADQLLKSIPYELEKCALVTGERSADPAADYAAARIPD